MVWVVRTIQEDRGLASERTNIERNNRECRLFSGFDAEIWTSEISLAAAEGWAAVGLCNLKPCLHDWTHMTDTAIITKHSDASVVDTVGGMPGEDEMEEDERDGALL